MDALLDYSQQSDNQTLQRKPTNNLNLLLFFVLTAATLYFGKALFIPLTISFLLAFILYPVCHSLEKKGIPSAIAIGISMLILVIFFASLFGLLLWQFSRFSLELPALQSKILSAFNEITNYIQSHFNISIQRQEDWLENITDNSGEQVLPLLKTTINSISIIIVFAVLIPIISALILYQRQQLFLALHYFTPSISLEKLRTILQETITTYYNFIKGMLIVYVIVGLLNSIGLLILGIPHAFLFGFIAAILTFIPYVGIIIGALLPIAVSWITFNSLWYPAGVIIVFTIVQYLEANIIFPWAVSGKLKINTLSTIVAILAGGILWGSAGMILFIPFLGILKLLADRTAGMEAISILLESKPKKNKNQKKN